METQTAIKLVKELKANKFLPKFNVLHTYLLTYLQSQCIYRIKPYKRLLKKSGMNSIRSIRSYSKNPHYLYITTFRDENFDRENQSETAKILLIN